MILRHSRRKLCIGLVLWVCFRPWMSYGQASATAVGPGGYVAAGGRFLASRSPYISQQVVGYSVFLDANVSRRIGIEAESQRLFLPSPEGTRSTAYLVGPRIAANKSRYHPYAKFLVGEVNFKYPYQYAKGNYAVFAPGAGLDVSILHGRAYVRICDVEWQYWKDFTFGSAHPVSVSSGLSVRIF